VNMKVSVRIREFALLNSDWLKGIHVLESERVFIGGQHGGEKLHLKFDTRSSDICMFSVRSFPTFFSFFLFPDVIFNFC
jgi:hypothetical protein